MKVRNLPIFVLALLFLPLLSRGDTRLVNGIAVIVGDSVITYKEILTRTAKDEAFLADVYGDRPAMFVQKRQELWDSTVEELVQRRLILKEFNTAGYNLPESWIQDRISRDIKTYGDRLTLTRTLQAEGITFETYRRRVRENIIIEAMWQQNVPGDPIVSPFKIEQYYAQNTEEFNVPHQVKLRMIVLPKRPGETPGSTLRLGEEILSKLNEGAAFAEMAKLYSTGQHAAEGGDWGWIDRNVLRPELDERAFAMRAGQRSDVIETPEACYIMLVEENRAAHTKTLADVRDEIEAKLKAEETNRMRKRWIDRLKTKTLVRYLL
jgi:peptidyl-prolyl cis-trans isomerase SurA